MWWNKDGLTSGGAECAPVRVFLVPSFCVFMCRFAIRGCGTAGICVPFGVRRRGCYCWQWFLALALFRRRNACHQCAWLLEKLGLWRGRGIYPPWCGLRGGAGGVPGAPKIVWFYTLHCPTRTPACANQKGRNRRGTTSEGNARDIKRGTPKRHTKRNPTRWCRHL